MIGPDAPMAFPPPTGEYSKLTDTEFRGVVETIIQHLHQFQSEMDKENPYPKIDPRDRQQFLAARDKWKESRQKKAAIFEAEFGSTAKSIASELVSRANRMRSLGTINVPPDEQIGAQVILQNKFAGPKPADSVANFLHTILQALPN
ncbi:MAG TPA: hypothetical protein VHX43_07575 [Xanthobacteraceae bacterium]|nr:hypothetical protein [Xanthobacteraceae bacterium]